MTRALDPLKIPSQDPIARRIQQILDERQWSARELSERAKLSDGAVGKILARGGALARVATLVQIATAARVSLVWLIVGEGPREAAKRPESG